jgi:CRISPR-associated protein Cst1
MRDWYFNAGITGFLRVISNDEVDIEKIKTEKKDHLLIGDNYIEFDNSVLDGFIERVTRLVFLHLFSYHYEVYKRRVKSVIDIIEKENTEQKDKNEKKVMGVSNLKANFLNGKVINAFFNEIGFNVEGIKETEILKNTLKEIEKKLSKFNSVEVFYKEYKDGNFVPYFLSVFLEKRIVALNKFNKYIDSICRIDYKKKNANNDICLSCQERSSKGGFTLDNSISNIIGFNTDNSNWVWGYKSGNVYLCGVCALIYSCAVLAFIPFSKGQEQYWYYINSNSNIDDLYRESQLFLRKFTDNIVENKPFSHLIRQTIIDINNERARKINDNINFIEIAEGGIGGQSSKSYHIFNYIISPELARFIVSLGDKGLPKGGYAIGDDSFDITEELIQKTIVQQIGYDDLWRYFNVNIRGNMKAYFSLYLVRAYIFKYINYFKEGGNMKTEMENISKKAYWNGEALRIKIGKENEKKINGIAYRLLNALKIADREKFLDIYIRLMMSYDMELSFGSNKEMTDNDGFLQFGYSFLNGLLSKDMKGKEDNKNG